MKRSSVAAVLTSTLWTFLGMSAYGEVPGPAGVGQVAKASVANAGSESVGDRSDGVWQENALLGTWDLLLTFSDGSQVKSTLSVLPGRRSGEGSVIHAAEASLLLPNPTTPEQGAWTHEVGRYFVASYRGYSVDATFEHPAGQVGFRHRMKVSFDGRTFSGLAVFEVFDTSGVVVFSDQVQTQGTRRRALAP